MIKRLTPLLAAIIGVVALALIITGAKAADPPADTYVGVAQCATCHNGSVMPDVVTPWSQTGHGKKLFKELSDPARTTWGDAQKTTYGSRCIGCHTVGFNTKVDENGFDDLLLKDGWNGTMDVGDFIVTKFKSLDDFKANSKAAPLANIQCENCHGPGRIHDPTVDYSTKTCDTCHSQNKQWNNSGHGAGAYVASNPAEQSHIGNAPCATCHSAEGFVNLTVRGESSLAATAKNAIACVACHDPHSKANDRQLRLEGKVKLPTGLTVNAGDAAVCVTCHNGRRTTAEMNSFVAGTATRGPHGNTQGAMLYGAGGFDYGQAMVNSYHSTLEESCITCHMAKTPGGGSHDADYDPKAPGRDKLGGHSWGMEVTVDGKAVENAKNACGSCHEGLTSYDRTARGDYDADGKIEGVQTEIQGLLDALKPKLPKGADGNVLTSGITTSNTTEAQRKALWNYNFVVNDGSKGVHNTNYAVLLLKASINDLKGVAPVTAAAPAAPAALPKTGSPIPVEAVSGLVGMGVALVGLGGLFVRRRAH